MAAAAATAMLVWLCRQGAHLDLLGEELKGFLPAFPWNAGGRWGDKVENNGIQVVAAAVEAVSKGRHSLRQVLYDSVAFTGDVDTVAAIALAAGSLHPDIKNDLPHVLYTQLENDTYGLNYLQDLDIQLSQALPKPVVPPI
jgi:hypothetical protein